MPCVCVTARCHTHTLPGLQEPALPAPGGQHLAVDPAESISVWRVHFSDLQRISYYLVIEYYCYLIITNSIYYPSHFGCFSLFFVAQIPAATVLQTPSFNLELGNLPRWQDLKFWVKVPGNFSELDPTLEARWEKACQLVSWWVLWA